MLCGVVTGVLPSAGFARQAYYLVAGRSGFREGVVGRACRERRAT